MECFGERADGNNESGVNKNKHVRAASRFFLHFILFLKPSQDRHHSLLFVLSHVVFSQLLPCFYFLLLVDHRSERGISSLNDDDLDWDRIFMCDMMSRDYQRTPHTVPPNLLKADFFNLHICGVKLIKNI